MPRKKGRQVAFEWKGEKIFLPEVVITSELRQAADDVYFKRTNLPKSESEWNPSWSDDSDTNSDDLFRVIKITTKTKKSKKVKPSSDLLDATSNKNGSLEEGAQEKKFEGAQSPKKISNEPSKPEEANLFRRKFYSKEELFRNWSAHQPEKTASEDEPEKKNENLSEVWKSDPTKVEVKTLELKCKDCDKVFAKKIHLTLHQKIHSRMEKHSSSRNIQDTYACSTSQRQVERKEKILSYIEEDHATTGPKKIDKTEPEFVCGKCNRRFERSNQLKLHINLCKSSSNINPVCNSLSEFVCEKCDRKFDRSNQLKLHRNLCKSRSNVNPVSSSPSAFVCEKCDRKFDRSNQLKLHRNLCKSSSNINPVSSSPSEFVCGKCGRKFDRSNQLMLHSKLCKGSNLHSVQSLVHEDYEKERDAAGIRNQTSLTDIPTPGRKNFTCTDCGRQFKHQHYLNFHKKIHSKTCKGCFNAFHESEYEDHVQTCLVANESAMSLVSFSSITTSTEKCSTCEKSFSNQDALSQHQLLHKYCFESFYETEEEQFWNHVVCDQEECNSKFSDEADLSPHLEKKHNIQPSSNPTNYYIQDKQLPPLNPYVLIAGNVKQPADALWQNQCLKTATIATTPRMLKHRGKQPRTDIPFQNIYLCEICDKKFTKRNLYIIHISQHKYYCQICERKLWNAAMFKAHMDIHAVDPTFKAITRPRFRHDIPLQSIYICQTCNKSFSKRNPYISHIAAHKREEKFTCKTCERKFQTEAAFKLHMDRHAADPSYRYGPGTRGYFRTDIPFQDEYTCETCGEKFDKRNLFLLHLREEKYKCKICERGFQSEAHLEAHMKRHDDPSYVPGKRGRFRDDIPIQSEYTCQTCQKTFKQRNYYIIHISQHKREEQYRCKICERGFLNEAMLQTHVKRHDDPSYVPGTRGIIRSDIPFQDEYTCETCGEKFDKRNLFLLHLREEKYKCKICERGYQSEALLEAHVKRHNDPSYVPGTRGYIRSDIPFQDEYTCEICGDKFNKRNLFLLHLREEKYKCKICGRGYQTEALLKAHIKRHSDPSYVPGKRGRQGISVPFQDVYDCEKCEKSFSNRKNYICHLYYHRQQELRTENTNRRILEIPYQDVYFCDKCNNREFIRREEYIQHLYFHKNTGTYTVFGKKGRRPRRSDIPIQDVYNCEHCPKSFTDRIKYILHQKIHASKSHKCDGCLKMFKTTQARDLHKEKFCKGIPCKFKCDRCNDRFHNKITLARHFHRFHSKVLESAAPEIEYPCNQCSQTFNTTFGLIRHRQVYHPNSDFTLEQDNAGPRNDYYESNSPHFWNSDEDSNPMLVANLCEAELSEDPVARNESDSEIKALKRQGNVCFCNQKYKTQKLCGSVRCACQKAGNRCSKGCNCASFCVNNAQLEFEQQQEFKKGKESMIQTVQTGEDEDESTPIVIGYSGGDAGEVLEPQPSTSSLGYNIPTSEFISVDGDGEQDETMHQLSLEGYVEEADDIDPLADSFGIQDEPHEVEPSQTEYLSVSTNNRSEVVLHATKSSPANINTVRSTTSTSNAAQSSTFTINQNIAGATLDTFNQSAHLPCQFCKKNFKIIPTYISHVLIHDVERTLLTCPICSKEFLDKVSDFAQHLEIHNKGIEIQCTKCSSKFKTYKDMERHLQVHHFRPMECGSCNIKFQNSQLMMSHWSKVHPTCQCGLCNVKFFSYDDLTFHMKSLHSPYDCLRCNERFEKLNFLLDHFFKKHSTKPSLGSLSQTRTCQIIFKCSHCSDTFLTGEDLNDHLTYHLSTPNATYGSVQYPTDRYECGQCKATFKSTEDLHDHLAHHIMGTGPFSSNVGQPSIPTIHPINTSSNPIISNVRTRFSPVDKEIEVQQFDDVVNDGTQAVEVFPCPKCTKGFQNRTGWRTHLLTTHNVVMCSACDSQFDTRQELSNHLQLNSSCIVYFCELCDRNFQAKKYLAQHKKFVHEGGRRSSISSNTNNTDSTTNGNPVAFSGIANTTGMNNTQSESSFPVIVASTSLAQNESIQAQPTTYYVRTHPPAALGQRQFILQVRQRQVQTQQREIEEIVLD